MLLTSAALFVKLNNQFFLHLDNRFFPLLNIMK